MHMCMAVAVFAPLHTKFLVTCVRCHAVTGAPIQDGNADDRRNPPRAVLGLCPSCREQYFRSHDDAFTPNPAS
jgi:hypothetical protein